MVRGTSTNGVRILIDVIAYGLGLAVLLLLASGVASSSTTAFAGVVAVGAGLLSYLVLTYAYRATLAPSGC